MINNSMLNKYSKKEINGKRKILKYKVTGINVLPDTNKTI